MEMFAKKLLVSFTVIVVFFTSIISYIHAEELPKILFSKAPGSSDIPGLSLGDTYAMTKFSRDPWKSGYMPFATPDFTKEFSSSRAQQPASQVEDPVFKPAGQGLNGWGRIPRIPKPAGQGLNGWGRIPRVPKPAGQGLNGWGRIPRVQKFSHRGTLHLRLPPIRPPHLQPHKVWPPRVPPPPIQAPPRKSQRVWTPLPAVDPPFEPPAPTPTPTPKPSPFKAPISVTTTSPSGKSQEFKHLIF